MIDWLQRHMLPCAYKSIFGIDCPGCGFQRSFIALLKGNWSQSFFLYPPTIPILLATVFLLIEPKLHLTKSKAVRKYVYISVGIIVFVSYGVKMVNLFVLHHASST